jgi:hypothetical protein
MVTVGPPQVDGPFVIYQHQLAQGAITNTWNTYLNAVDAGVHAANNEPPNNSDHEQSAQMSSGYSSWRRSQVMMPGLSARPGGSSQSSCRPRAVRSSQLYVPIKMSPARSYDE